MCLTISGFIYGQSQHLFTQTYQLRANVDLVNSQLKTYSFSSGVLAKFDQDELNVSFILKATEPHSYYDVSFKAFLNGQEITPLPSYLKGDLGKGQVIQRGEENRSFVWFGLAENFQQMKGKLNLIITMDYYGDKGLPYDISCFNPPQFGLKQKLPFLGSGLIGLGSLTSGIVLLRKGRKNYNRHLDFDSIRERDKYYDDATNQTDLAEVLTYAGVGILLADLSLYYFRKRKFKKQQAIYLENCTNSSVSFQPVLSIDRFQSINPGLQLSVRF